MPESAASPQTKKAAYQTVDDRKVVYMIKNWADYEVFLTVDDVSAMMNIPVESVRRMCRSGQLPAVKLGRLWRIDRDKFRSKLEQ